MASHKHITNIKGVCITCGQKPKVKSIRQRMKEMRIEDVPESWRPKQK